MDDPDGGGKAGGGNGDIVRPRRKSVDHPHAKSSADHLRGRSATLPAHLTRRSGPVAAHARHHAADASMHRGGGRTRSGGDASDDRGEADAVKMRRESLDAPPSRRPSDSSRSLPPKLTTTDEKEADIDAMVILRQWISGITRVIVI